MIELNIANLTYEQVLKKFEAFIGGLTIHSVVFMNPHMYLESRRTPLVAEYMKESDLILADGIGIVFAHYFLKGKNLHRVTGTDFMAYLCDSASRKGWKLFLLGAELQILKRTIEVLTESYHELNIVGHRDGYFEQTEEQQLVEEINSCKPDILVVCLGVPKQELFIKRHIAKLKTSVVFGNGAAFDWIARKHRRAPKWIQHMGLEWCWRLFSEPKRLWKRYLLGNISFLLLVLKDKLTLIVARNR